MKDAADAKDKETKKKLNDLETAKKRMEEKRDELDREYRDLNRQFRELKTTAESNKIYFAEKQIHGGRYVGEFLGDKRHGEGTFYNPSGLSEYDG
jgi:hypothetical protein